MFFRQNLVFTLKNYSNFKNNVLFNNGSVLEINDYYRTRRNVSFTELFEIRNTLSNQDFAGCWRTCSARRGLPGRLISTVLIKIMIIVEKIF